MLLLNTKFSSVESIFLFLIYITASSSHIIYINQLNKTHFTCGQDKNVILHIAKFNDDFCDCDDGSDENSKKFYIIIMLKHFFRNKCLYQWKVLL
jgi:hypothetical protein